MLNVLHFYASDLHGVAEGGIASYVRELLKQSKPDFQHKLVGVTRNDEHAPGQWGRMKIEGVELQTLPLFSVDHDHITYEKGMPLNARFLLALFRYRRLILRSADVLHFHRVELALPFVLWKKKGVPVVLTIHGSSRHHEQALGHRLFGKNWFNRLYLALEAFILERVDKVILVNSEGYDHYRQKFSRFSGKFVMFPTFIDFDLFKPCGDGSCRQKFGVPPDARLIVFVGRLHEQKGVSLLIEAFGSLQARRLGHVLLLVGDGGDKPRLQEQVRVAGIQGVMFAGAVAHAGLAEVLTAADLFVLPSLWEGMPIVLLEALACGVPAVSTDVGQVRDIIKEGENGYIVAGRSAGDMSDKMFAVLYNSSRDRERLRGSVKSFSSEHVVARIEQLYTELK